MSEETPQVRCPKCQSTQITANKKGYSGAKAVGGAIVAGPIGLLAGTLGSNKVKITCLACGHEFKPGDRPVEKTENKPLTTGGCVFTLVVLAILAYLIFS